MNLSSINLRFFANVAPLIGGLNKAERAMQQSGRAMQKLGGTLSLRLTAPIVAFGAVSTDAFKDFELEMSKVRAVSGATGDEFDMLKQNALELGRTTIFTAAEVANLQTEFAKLGFTAPQIDGVTASTLALAQATDSELGRSAEVVGNTLRGFQMDVSQTGHLTDVMAKSFSSSALDMEKFADSMKYVAPVANSAGMSIEETTAMLGILADAGIKGSQAGTSLRRIISELGAGSEPVAEKLKILADQGIGLADAKDEVGRSAQSALLVLANGVDKIDPFTQALKEADGSAQSMADTMNDTAYGSMKEFESAWEGLKISAGETIAKALRPLLDVLSSVFIAFTELPQGVQTTALVIMGLAAAIGPVVWILGTFQTALVAIRTATWLTTGATAAFGTVLNVALSPITLIILAVAALVGILAYLAYNFDTVKAVTINSLKYMANMGIKVLNPLIKTFNAVADALGFESVKINTFKEFKYESVPALKSVSQVISEIKDDLGLAGDEAKETTAELGGLSDVLDEIDEKPDPIISPIPPVDPKVKKSYVDLNAELERLAGLQSQYREGIIRQDLENTLQPLDAVSMGLEEFTDIDFEDAPVFKSLPKGFAKMQMAAIQMTSAISDAINQMAVDTIIGMSEMIGAMAVGQATMADLGSFVMGSFAGLLSTLGQILVQYGAGLLALKLATIKLDPYVALAAGAALLAIGAGVKAKLQAASESNIPAMAEGGIVTGPTLALIGEGRGPEAVIPLDKLDGFMGGGAQNINVTGRIQGSDILLSQERATRERSRYRGY